MEQVMSSWIHCIWLAVTAKLLLKAPVHLSLWL